MPPSRRFCTASDSDCSDDLRSSISGLNSDFASSASVSALSRTLSSASCSEDVPFWTTLTFCKSLIESFSACASSHTCDDEDDEDEEVGVVLEAGVSDADERASAPPHAASPAPSATTTAAAATRRVVNEREGCISDAPDQSGSVSSGASNASSTS